MGFNNLELLLVTCFCVCGLHYSLAIVAEIRDIVQKCQRDGGFCINIIPPPPPPQRRQQARRPAAVTQTRRGGRPDAVGRPDPRSLGDMNNRLPAAAATAAVPMGSPPVYPQQAPTAVTHQNNGFMFGDIMGTGGAAANDPLGSMMGLLMFARKKRQVMDPEAAAEIPRIQRGESLFNFLNTHCRKSDFDFGCRDTGGMCCLPHL